MNQYQKFDTITQRCVKVIFTIWRGLANPTCRDNWYTTTSQTEAAAECLPLPATASVSELTSDALYIRPHQINFMDDGFSAEKNGANERILNFFPKKN